MRLSPHTLLVAVVIERGSVWHHYGLGQTGAFAKTTTHDAVKRIYDNYLVIGGLLKNVFWADLNAGATAITKLLSDGGEPGDMFAGMTLPGAIVAWLRRFALL